MHDNTIQINSSHVSIDDGVPQWRRRVEETTSSSIITVVSCHPSIDKIKGTLVDNMRYDKTVVNYSYVNIYDI